jgi:RNA polymerase sigma factor (sigma-70 family)
MNPPPAEGFASRLVLGPMLRTQPDQRLVTLVREGYEAAFEEIVRRYGKPLRRYAAAIVGGRSEDVTQDAFSKALLALRRDGAEIELRPWLYRIVRNTALNDLRDRPAAAEELAEAIAGGRNPAEEFEQREELTDLMSRLGALPERQRAAIVMRELEGLSHEEIAAALGLSGGAARQAIYRARQALRDGLGLLLPLPLIRLLIDHGAEAAAAGAGGATVATAGVSTGAAGAGGALKVGIATVLVAGSVGTGVALKERSAGHAPASDREQATPRGGGVAGGASLTMAASLARENEAGGNPKSDRGRRRQNDHGSRKGKEEGLGAAVPGTDGRGPGHHPHPSHKPNGQEEGGPPPRHEHGHGKQEADEEGKGKSKGRGKSRGPKNPDAKDSAPKKNPRDPHDPDGLETQPTKTALHDAVPRRKHGKIRKGPALDAEALLGGDWRVRAARAAKSHLGAPPRPATRRHDRLVRLGNRAADD